MSSDGGFSVDPAALVKQAQDWDNRAAQMGEVAQQVAAANYTVPGYSIFEPAIGPYTQGCERVARWCGQAQAEMQSIASALITAAGRYGQAEEGAIKSIQAVGSELKGFSSEIAGSAGGVEGSAGGGVEGSAGGVESKNVNMIDQVINLKR